MHSSREINHPRERERRHAVDGPPPQTLTHKRSHAHTIPCGEPCAPREAAATELPPLATGRAGTYRGTTNVGTYANSHINAGTHSHTLSTSHAVSRVLGPSAPSPYPVPTQVLPRSTSFGYSGSAAGASATCVACPACHLRPAAPRARNHIPPTPADRHTEEHSLPPPRASTSFSPPPGRLAPCAPKSMFQPRPPLREGVEGEAAAPHAPRPRRDGDAPRRRLGAHGPARSWLR